MRRGILVISLGNERNHLVKEQDSKRKICLNGLFGAQDKEI